MRWLIKGLRAVGLGDEGERKVAFSDGFPMAAGLCPRDGVAFSGGETTLFKGGGAPEVGEFLRWREGLPCMIVDHEEEEDLEGWWPPDNC